MPTLPPAQHAALEDLMVAREWRPSPPRRPRSLAVGTEAPPDEVSDDIPTMALSRRELPRTARHRPSHVAPPHQPTYQQATTQPAAARHRSSTAITLRGHSPARPRRIDARRYNARALQVPAAYRLETEPVRRVSQAPTDAIRTRLSLCFVFFALLAGGAGAMGTIVLRQNLLLAPWASLVALALLPCIALAATALLAINFKLLRIPSALAMPSCAAFSALAFVTAALLSAWAAGLEVALGDLALSRHVFREAGALLTARLSELTGLSALHLSVWWLAQLGCVVFLALVLTRRCMRGRGI